MNREVNWCYWAKRQQCLYYGEQSFHIDKMAIWQGICIPLWDLILLNFPRVSGIRNFVPIFNSIGTPLNIAPCYQYSMSSLTITVPVRLEISLKPGWYKTYLESLPRLLNNIWNIAFCGVESWISFKWSKYRKTSIGSNNELVPPSRYLKQWLFSLLKRIRVTRPRWVDYVFVHCLHRNLENYKYYFIIVMTCTQLFPSFVFSGYLIGTFHYEI